MPAYFRCISAPHFQVSYFVVDEVLEIRGKMREEGMLKGARIYFSDFFNWLDWMNIIIFIMVGAATPLFEHLAFVSLFPVPTLFSPPSHSMVGPPSVFPHHHLRCGLQRPKRTGERTPVLPFLHSLPSNLLPSLASLLSISLALPSTRPGPPSSWDNRSMSPSTTSVGSTTRSTTSTPSTASSCTSSS